MLRGRSRHGAAKVEENPHRAEVDRNRFAVRFDGADGDRDGIEERSSSYQRLMLELLHAQRLTLVRLRDAGCISDEAMHRIERDLDLEESRLEV